MLGIAASSSVVLDRDPAERGLSRWLFCQSSISDQRGGRNVEQRTALTGGVSRSASAASVLAIGSTAPLAAVAWEVMPVGVNNGIDRI